eukprot:3301995-Pyramimonas_sp.AAC.1
MAAEKGHSAVAQVGDYGNNMFDTGQKVGCSYDSMFNRGQKVGEWVLLTRPESSGYTKDLWGVECTLAVIGTGGP